MQHRHGAVGRCCRKDRQRWKPSNPSRTSSFQVQFDLEEEEFIVGSLAYPDIAEIYHGAGAGSLGLGKRGLLTGPTDRRSRL